jgi:phospholipase A1/A2
MMPAPKHRDLRVRPLAAAVLLGLALTGDTLAQSGASADLAACASIASDQARLECYDRTSGRTAASPAAVPGPEPPRSAMNPPAVPKSGQPDPTPAISVAAPDSRIDAAWGFEPDSSRYLITLHRPNFIQLARYSDRPNDAPFEELFDALGTNDAERQSTEAEFQISFKARLWASEDRRLGVWAAYTQQSQWQVFNEDISRPFRETNYEPELIVSYRPDISFGDVHWRLFNVGFNHQSNGRADPLSRSWDRLTAEFGLERGDFALLVRPWYVVDEGGDDNPDITDYYGYGDLTGVYNRGGHSFSLMGRGNPGTGKGAARFTWTTPPLLGPLRGYVDVFSGYGESMIDYNWYQNSIGIGVTLNGLLDRPAWRD